MPPKAANFTDFCGRRPLYFLPGRRPFLGGGVGFEYTKTIGLIHINIWTNTHKHPETYKNKYKFILYT